MRPRLSCLIAGRPQHSLQLLDRGHLDRLLRDFALYYNDYRGHTALGGAVPAVRYRGERWDKPERSAKTLPTNPERRFFPDTKVTAYRLAA